MHCVIFPILWCSFSQDCGLGSQDVSSRSRLKRNCQRLDLRRQTSRSWAFTSRAHPCAQRSTLLF